MNNSSEIQLGLAVNIKKGKITTQSDFKRRGYLPLINTEALVGDAKLFANPKEGITCDSTDVLMLWDGERSGLVATGQVGVVGSTFARLRPEPNINSKYLFYFLQGKYQWIQNNRTGTGVPHVAKDIGRILVIRYPNYAVQQKIAKILSTIDGQIVKTEAIIAKYQAVKQGMLQDLFTRGIDVAKGELRPRYEDAPELYKDSPLGMIPKEWEVVRLDNVCQMKSGEGITSNSITEVGEYPVFGGNGLRGYTDTFTHNGNYVLIGRQGALCGNITKADGKFYASEHAVVVTLFEKMDTDWMAEKLEMMTLNKYSEASAQPGLSVSKILRLQIVKPRYEEQKNISKKVNQVNEQISIEQANLEKMRFVKNGLMSDLLSGKVEVLA